MPEQLEGNSGGHNVDLDAYLARIGYNGGLGTTLETLEGLHLGHATSIPFENLDILLGRGISLELDALQKKLVAGRRGGYCFEQNALFAAVLEALGFSVTRLAARVRFGATGVRPRSHMLLAVTIESERWLADVGFGGEGLLKPIHAADAEGNRQFAWTFRAIRDRDEVVVQSLHDDGWFDLYSFTWEPQYPVDYVATNYYLSAHPHSPFVQNLVVQRNSAQARWTLHNRELTEEHPGQKTTQILPDDDALLVALSDVFELHFPAGTRFRQLTDTSLSDD